MYARFAGVGVGHETQYMVPAAMDMPENDDNEDGIDGDEVDVGCTAGTDMGEAQDEAPSSDHEGDPIDEDDGEDDSDGADLDGDSSDEHNNGKDSSDDDEAVDNFVF